ncbi:MAG: hypothetical protein HQ483_18695 [Rhodospirillales bacterium]|nr:hypothetical protein [Rhodospirillales bacterium]
MNNVYSSNIDHEYYARVGRELRARELGKLFSNLGTQIKKTFSGKPQKNGADMSFAQKC